MYASRFLSVAALTLMISLPAHAQKADKRAQPETPRAYVETSYLIAPRQVAGFTLNGTQFDEKNKYAGAGFRYAAQAAQGDVRIDVYVYPAGKMSQSAALDGGMDTFRSSIRQAEAEKIYANVVMQDVREFPLSADLPATAGDSTRDKDEAGILAAIASAARVTGRKLAMTMDRQDAPVYSNGYLFYKQLYFFKVRVSAEQKNISAEQFGALADRAARTLVPSIEVVNIGDCANSTVYIDTNHIAKTSTEEVAKALVTQTTLQQGYNCHGDLDDAKINEKTADATMVQISYDPQEWKSQ